MCPTTNYIKYALIDTDDPHRKPCNHRHVCVQVCLLFALCVISSAVVFITWSSIYRHQVNVPPIADAFPAICARRAHRIAFATYSAHRHPNATPQTPPETSTAASDDESMATPGTHTIAAKHFDHELVYPSIYGNFLSASAVQRTTAYRSSGTTDPSAQPPADPMRLVCYYVALPADRALPAHRIDAELCTHLNIGMASVSGDDELLVDATLDAVLRDSVDAWRARNPRLRILLWIGGGDAERTFAGMVRSHATRMHFVRSVLAAVRAYKLDGIDVDWEFPAGDPATRERQHFSQLLHEIRRAYQRQRLTYTLSVAVAAPETIARLAYDVREIDQYVDHVNVMTYDYHMWSRWTPFTGLNAPLSHRPDESGYLALLNVNASVRFWEAEGLTRSKLVIGLPSYGHSFKLVSPFNADIMSPASGFGDLGDSGFVTYSDVCWFMRNNYFVRRRFDAAACSPYLSAGHEWLSYEDERSIACKAAFIRSNAYGGAMLFSLNADDWRGECSGSGTARNATTFPLLRRLHAALFERTNDGDS